jgi:hypothetical protein
MIKEVIINNRKIRVVDYDCALIELCYSVNTNNVLLFSINLYNLRGVKILADLLNENKLVTPVSYKNNCFVFDPSNELKLMTI